MNTFSTRLKELRIEKGLTQKNLADAIGTTDDSIFSWEKGRSQPSFEMLKVLCTFFDVSSDYFIGLEDETGAKVRP